VTKTNSSSPRSLRFVVRLTPKGGRNAVEGWQAGAFGKPVLKARVAAPPEDGKANAALVELMAETLDVARSKVKIVSGSSARIKTIEVEGDGVVLAARLAEAGRAA
jgi:uncharacterized protein (TIGR00251 family)